MVRRLALLLGMATLPGCWLASSFDFPDDAGLRDGSVAPMDAASDADAASAAPIAFVQGASSSFGNEATQHSLAFEAGIQPNDTIIVAFSYPSSVQTPTISDTFNNPYTFALTEESTAPPNGTWFGLAYALGSPGGPNIVTVALTDKTVLELYLAEFSGSLHLVAGSAEATGDSSASLVTDGISSGPLADAGSAASAALVVGFAVADTVSPGTGFRSATLLSDGVLEYRIGPLDGGPQTVTATMNGSSDWGIVANAFTP